MSEAAVPRLQTSPCSLACVLACSLPRSLCFALVCLEWNDDEMAMTSCQGLVTRWLEDRLRSDDDDHHVCLLVPSPPFVRNCKFHYPPSPAPFFFPSSSSSSSSSVFFFLFFSLHNSVEGKNPSLCVCVCFFRGHNSVQGNSQYKVLELGDLIFESFFFGILSSRDGSCLLSLSLFHTGFFFLCQLQLLFCHPRYTHERP